MNNKNLNEFDVIQKYNEIRHIGKVSKLFNVCTKKISLILKKNNIKIGKCRFKDGVIIRKYEQVKTISKTCDALGLSETYVSGILKRNNITTNNFKSVDIGDIFDYLSVIEVLPSKKSNSNNLSIRMLKCLCKCGNIIIRSSGGLRAKGFKSCGCHIKERKERNRIIKEQNRIEIEKRKEENKLREELRIKKWEELRKKYIKYDIGCIFGKLTIIGREPANIKHPIIVKCECGNIKNMSHGTLRTSKTCGCGKFKHTLSPKKINNEEDKKKRRWYDKWKSMISRCNNPKSHAFHNYGGRGIKVCDRWLEPNGDGCRNYINDIHSILGEQPGEGYSLDRINNDGNYEISNMRWATASEQGKNQRKRRLKK